MHEYKAWYCLSLLTLIGCSTHEVRGDDAGTDLGTSTLSRDASRFDGSIVTAEPDAPDAPKDSHHEPLDAPVECANGTSSCEGECADLARSTSHCGACARSCPAAPHASPACTAGACGLVCEDTYADCDHDASNGCETSLRSPLACGACGARCTEPEPFCDGVSATARCVSGCIGASGLRCDLECVDRLTNVRHCGSCGLECPTPRNARAVCVDGTCGFECDVTAHLCEGACVPNDMTETCGSRCTPCPTAQNMRTACEGGACTLTCLSGWHDCDGDPSNGCEFSTRSDPAHCGACDRVCADAPNAQAACSDGRCVIVCEPTFANCDGDLSNGCESSLYADASCGFCRSACEPGAACLRGVCAPCTALSAAEGGRAEVADAPPLRLGNTSFTVEAWLFATDYPNRCQHAIATKRGSMPSDGWFFAVTGSGCGVPARRLFFQVSGGSDPHAIAGVDAPTGRWFHAAATYDLGSRSLRLWQDGMLVGAATLPPPSVDSVAPLFLANDSTGDPYTWRGHLDDVRISNVVRYDAPFTPAAQLSRDGQIVALWSFWSSGGLTVDQSSRGYVAFLRDSQQSAQSAYCRR